MKKLLLIFFLLLNVGANAQKQDYVWLQGFGSYGGFDTGWGFYFGITKLDFNYSPRHVSYDSLGMNFDKTNTSMCDSNGNLLFYSNGIYIANKLDEKIENSDSLNAGAFQYEWDSSIQHDGYRTPQGIIALPFSNNPNRYHLIHSFVDTINIADLLGKRILYTLLDMSENAGHGKVEFKNHVIVDDSIQTSFTACRHGNGRDWWILILKNGTGCSYRLLVTDNGIEVLPTLTCFNDTISRKSVCSVCFSPDGSKYVFLDGYKGLYISDFDRCSGEISNTIHIPMYLSGALGTAISPNSRFLYASMGHNLFQFDLQAADIPGSMDTVGVFDNTNAPFPAVFHTAQSGPDGKIYISCGNTDTVYHVIERPDEKGDSCLFKQHSLSLPSPSAGVPSFPNYRLGALAGSACDTLTGLVETERAEKERIIKVFPNPATDFITIDYGFTDWNKGEADLEITNALGQIVHKQKLPMYSGYQKLDISSYPSGVYNAFIMRGSSPNGGKGTVVAVAKWVKE